jgi:carboxyl-terminal processing protease
MSLHPRYRRIPRLALAGGTFAASTLLSVFSPSLSPSVSAALHDSPKVVLDEAWQIVNRDYVDTSFNQVDWQAVRHELLDQEYSSRSEAYAALRRALERLEDPYTRFMDPEEYRSLTTQTSGEVSGIGIRIRLDQPTQALIVVDALENSPAARAGLRAGDRILSIDDQSTEGMTVEKASEMIRGEVGSEVKIRISRSGLHEQTIAVLRERIEIPTVRHALKQEGDARIGYIRLNEFNAHASEQMRRAIQSLNEQQVEGFVLDLRGNPGGLLRSSIDISRMWLNRGAIVKTVDRQGDSEEVTANGTALTNLPLVILVDGNSASSSEILTGALKDNHRATIVGSKTFGKALVQSVHALSDGSGLAVTIAHYYTPMGTDISSRGITPDIQIDLSGQDRRRLASDPNLLGTTADPQYQSAISALRTTIVANRRDVAPVTQRPAPQVADLEARNEARHLNAPQQ